MKHSIGKLPKGINISRCCGELPTVHLLNTTQSETGAIASHYAYIKCSNPECSRKSSFHQYNKSNAEVIRKVADEWSRRVLLHNELVAEREKIRERIQTSVSA